MKKGFTLVELLVVIALIGLLIAIAVPSGIAISNKIKKNMLDTKIELIENGAIEWGQKNKSQLSTIKTSCTQEIKEDEKVSHCISKSISFLLNENALEEDKLDESGNEVLINPITNTPLNDCSVDIYIKNKRVYAKYDINETNCGFEINNPPSIEDDNSDSEDPPVKEIYMDSSGANYPNLAYKMIPVYYDYADNVWKVADIYEKWYSYTSAEKWWANAIKVSNYNDYVENGEFISNKMVDMDDILSMWVWIPRFMYKIPHSLGSTSYVSSPPEIEIIFEPQLETNGVTESVYRSGIKSDGTNSNYYTHPAFRDGSNVYKSTPYDLGGWDRELTGFWMGKYLTTGTSTAPVIKPSMEFGVKGNLPSYAFDYIDYNTMAYCFFVAATLHSTSFPDGYSNPFAGFPENEQGYREDSHVIKNTEYGAVLYLSHSMYGIGKLMQINSSNFTGGTSSQSSTTGNIYGVFDMNSVVEKSLMATMNKNESPCCEYSGFPSNDLMDEHYFPTIPWPYARYYDLYNTWINASISTPYDFVKENSILGDATWETKYWYSNHGTKKNYEGWFKRGRRGTPGPESPYDISAQTGKCINFYTVLIT